MKTVKVTYGLTVCFISLALVLIYIHVQVPRQTKVNRLLLKDTYSVKEPKSQTETQNSKLVNDSASILKWRPTEIQTEFVNHQPPEPAPPPTPTVTPLSKAHIVAIVSYMRSGSTLTADILQHFPGAVYVFEPLHTVFIRTRQKKALVFLNGRTRKLNPSDLSPDFIADQLNKWFTCRYEELDVHSLTDNFHTHYSRTMRKLSDCWKPKKRTLGSIRQCLPIAIEMCKTAKHRLFKFIRVPMKIMESILPLYPKLQIIHLIRDPRGSLTSQIKLKKHSWNEVDTASKQHCTQMATDLESTGRLYQKFPKRAKVLLYEDVAEQPTVVAKRLYGFLNLPVYTYVINYVHKITQAGKTDGTAFGIIRGNSTKTAYSWRDVIVLKNSMAIDKNCKSVYDLLGYQPLTNLQDVRTHLHRSWVEPNLPMII